MTVEYCVERRDWFGDCTQVGPYFKTEKKAQAWAARLRQISRACDDPDDKVTHRVVRVELGPVEREAVR